MGGRESVKLCVKQGPAPGLTGQTVPGRRIPAAIGRTWARMSWPRPNRLLPGLETCSFLLPPHERVLAKLGRHGLRLPDRMAYIGRRIREPQMIPDSFQT